MRREGGAQLAPIPASPARRDLARGFATVTAANLVGNLFAYGLLLSAARVLVDADYAGIVAMLNLLLVGTVPAFALQAVVARRVAVGDADDLRRIGALIALGGGVVFAAVIPIEIAFLNLPGLWSTVLLAVAVPGIALQGFCQGMWQGRQHFTGLAAATFLGLVGRSGGGLAGLLLTRSATGAMAGIAIGVTIMAATNLWLVVRSASTSPPAIPSATPSAIPSVGTQPVPVRSGSTALAETARAGHAYGAFLVLTVTDLLLANHVLDQRAAAVYAAGSVMTKVALWLPQSLANVLFAAMTDHQRHRRLFLRTATALLVLGAAVVLVSALAGGLVVRVLAGAKYPELHAHVWLFAALGSSLALLQFAMVTGLAIRDGRATVVVWLTVVCEAVYVLSIDTRPTVTSIIAGVASLNLVAAAALFARRLRPVPPLRRRDRRATDPG
jgi:hypothetical protein